MLVTVPSSSFTAQGFCSVLREESGTLWAREQRQLISRWRKRQTTFLLCITLNLFHKFCCFCELITKYTSRPIQVLSGSKYFSNGFPFLNCMKMRKKCDVYEKLLKYLFQRFQKNTLQYGHKFLFLKVVLSWTQNKLTRIIIEQANVFYTANIKTALFTMNNYVFVKW